MSKRKSPVERESPKFARRLDYVPPCLPGEIELSLTFDDAAWLARNDSIEYSDWMENEDLKYRLFIESAEGSDGSIWLSPGLELDEKLSVWYRDSVHFQVLAFIAGDSKLPKYESKEVRMSHKHSINVVSNMIGLSPECSSDDEVSFRLIAMPGSPLTEEQAESEFLGTEKFSGLQNLGATCYLNGLLQSLFYLGRFRELVYLGNDGVNGCENGETPVLTALRRVFYALERGGSSVSCRPLVEAFGWKPNDLATQHDAQELSRLLCEKVEDELKPSGRDKDVRALFEGKMENFIECIDVDFSSRRMESFYDLQVHISGEKDKKYKNLSEALEQLTATEMLEGVDAYDAEGHGKQKAKKGVRIAQLPPVLNLQFMRFRFNYESGDMEKIYDKFDFPDKLDLAPFLRNEQPDVAHANEEDALSKSIGFSTLYVLKSILVHSGSVNAGHYYSYVNLSTDCLTPRWYKFDDDKVSAVPKETAIDGNFGGRYSPLPGNYFKLRRSDNIKPFSAYLVVYVREDFFKINVPSLETTNPIAFESIIPKVKIFVISESVFLENVSKSVLWDDTNFRIPDNEKIVSSELKLCDILPKDRKWFALGSCGFFKEISNYNFQVWDGAVFADWGGWISDLSVCTILLKRFDNKKIKQVEIVNLPIYGFFASLDRFIKNKFPAFLCVVEKSDGSVETVRQTLHPVDGMVFIYHELDGESICDYVDGVKNKLTVPLSRFDPSESLRLKNHLGVERVLPNAEVESKTVDVRDSATSCFGSENDEILIFSDVPTSGDHRELFCGYIGDLKNLLDKVNVGFVPVVHLPKREKGFRLCLRFFDDSLNELHAMILLWEDGEFLSLSDFMCTVRKNLEISSPKWLGGGFDFALPCRIFEVVDGEIGAVWINEDWGKVPVESLACFGKGNPFYNCLRIENRKTEHPLIRCSQFDRSSNESFGHPFLLEDNGDEFIEMIRKKFTLSYGFIKSWKIDINDRFSITVMRQLANQPALSIK